MNGLETEQIQNDTVKNQQAFQCTVSDHFIKAPILLLMV